MQECNALPLPGPTNRLGVFPLEVGAIPDGALRLHAGVEALVPQRWGGRARGHHCACRGSQLSARAVLGGARGRSVLTGGDCQAPTSPTSVLGTGRETTWTLLTLPTATAVIAAAPVSLAAGVVGTTIVHTSQPPPPPRRGSAKETLRRGRGRVWCLRFQMRLCSLAVAPVTHPGRSPHRDTGRCVSRKGSA